MARMDWGFDDEAQRLQGRLAGEAGGGGRAAPAPAAPKPRLARQLGESARGAGQILRTGTQTALNRSIEGVEKALNTVAAPTRAGYDIGSQFRAGLTGSEPAPGLPKLSLSRVNFDAGRGGAAAAPAPANPSGPQNGRPNNGRARMGAAVPAPAAATTDLGVFTGDQGYRTQGFLQPAPGRLAAGTDAAPATTPFNANAAVAPAVDSQRRVARLVRGDAAEYLNPASQQAEMMRRAENAAGSYFLKGRPGARNAIVAANLGQIAAGNDASGQFQRAAGEAIQAGAEGAVRQGLGAEADAGRARLQREGFEQASALQAQQSAEAEQRGREVVGADGRLLLRRGNAAAPVLDESGNPVRMPAAAQPGQLTPKDLLEAYTKEREAIAGSLGSQDEKAAALAALDANPLFQPLVSGGAGAAPDLGTFLSAARAANPGVSDEELTAYYTQTYGAR